MGTASRRQSRAHTDKGDGFLWAERSCHWLNTDVNAPSFSRSRRIRDPLIVTGHGARLSVNNGCLLVRSGFTHFPQKATVWRFFPNDSNRPSRIIVLDGSGSLSFDAMSWLSRNDVPLIRINWRGEIQAIFGSNYSQNPKLVEKQGRLSENGKSIRIGNELIAEKIKNSILTIGRILPRSKIKTQTLAKLKFYKERLKTTKNINQILGIEGVAAISYFEAWQSLPIKWEGTKRKPIPADWYQIGLRSSVTRQKTKNRNASHPVNAMLNYAYGVLESQARIQILASGYDPSVGFLHTRVRGNSALVFDLMEPIRPIVDQAVLAFIQGNIFSPSDFVIRPDGVCRLHPNLAAAIVAMTTSVANSNRLILLPRRFSCA